MRIGAVNGKDLHINFKIALKVDALYGKKLHVKLYNECYIMVGPEIEKKRNQIKSREHCFGIKCEAAQTFLIQRRALGFALKAT